MGGGVIIIWILVFFGIFYFLAIRPQRRQRQAHSEMVQMLKKGDEVVTIGGMFGTVTRIGDDWVELEIAKRTRVRYLKRAVSSITAAEEEDEDEYIETEAEEEDDQAQLTEGEDVVEDTDEAVVTDDEAPEEPQAPEPPKS
jgi:preprotein translocase subunit YajC